MVFDYLLLTVHTLKDIAPYNFVILAYYTWTLKTKNLKRSLFDFGKTLYYCFFTLFHPQVFLKRSNPLQKCSLVLNVFCVLTLLTTRKSKDL